MHTPSSLAALFLVVVAALSAPAPVEAQESERFTLQGNDVVIHNLVGEIRLSQGDGPSVQVEVERRGPDASRIRVDRRRAGGRETVAVIFPENRVIYEEMGRGSRSTLRVASDGTLGESGRSVTVAGSGRGIRGHAVVHVRLPANGRAELHQGVGAVRADGARGTLRIHARSARTEVRAWAGDLEIRSGSGRIELAEVQGSVEARAGSGRIEVSAIQGDALDLRTGSGRIVVTGAVVSSLEAQAGSGRLSVDAVRAERTALSTGSGRQDISDLTTGSLDARANSGGLRLDRVMARQVTARTGSGAMRIALLGSPREVDLRSGSGSVRLALPADSDAALDINTGSGSIGVDLPATEVSTARSRYSGTLGTGTGTVRVRTGSGSVRLSGS